MCINSDDIVKMQVWFWGQRDTKPVSTSRRRRRLVFCVQQAYQSSTDRFMFKMTDSIFICERAFLGVIGLGGSLTKLHDGCKELVKLSYPQDWGDMKSQVKNGLQPNDEKEKQLRDRPRRKFEEAAAFLRM
jgi:hypothetical protein